MPPYPSPLTSFFFFGLPHLSPVLPEAMPETIPLALLLWCREAGVGGAIVGFLWRRRPRRWGSPSRSCVSRHCRTGCHPARVLTSSPAWQRGARAPWGAHVCWHLGSVGSQLRWLKSRLKSRLVGVPARGRQELDGRAGHPPGRSAPSSLPLVLLQRRHQPVRSGQGKCHPPRFPRPLRCPQLCSRQTELD